MKVKSIIDTNVSEPCSDSDFFPLKLARDIPLDCWPHNQLHNFTEFVAFTVSWKDDLGRCKDTYNIGRLKFEIRPYKGRASINLDIRQK